MRHAPIALQAVGALCVAWAMGALLGLAVGVLTFGVEALVAGTLAELEPRAARKARREPRRLRRAA